MIAAGVDPAHAPEIPDQFGATAQAGKDNTVYAHVWNLGQAPVVRADTGAMPWLHLVTMSRTTLPQTAAATGIAGLTAPTPAGTPLPDLGGMPNPGASGLIAGNHAVTGDDQQVGFFANDNAPGAGQAHVYRVTGTQDGTVFGGYTVVVLG